MTVHKLCPLNTRNKLPECIEHKCAWWIMGKCAIADIALSLDQLRIALNHINSQGLKKYEKRKYE